MLYYYYYAHSNLYVLYTRSVVPLFVRGISNFGESKNRKKSNIQLKENTQNSECLNVKQLKKVPITSPLPTNNVMVHSLSTAM